MINRVLGTAHRSSISHLPDDKLFVCTGQVMSLFPVNTAGVVFKVFDGGFDTGWTSDFSDHMASRSVMISCRMESSFFLPGSSPVSLALRASWFRLIPILFSSYRMRFNSRGLAFTCFSISTALANEEKLISVISALSFSSISSSSVTYTFSNRSSFGRFLLSCFDVELAIGKPVQVFNLEHRRCEKSSWFCPIRRIWDQNQLLAISPCKENRCI